MQGQKKAYKDYSYKDYSYKDFTIEEHIRGKFSISPNIHVKVTNIFGVVYTITERDTEKQTINSWKCTVVDTGEKYEIEKQQDGVPV